MAITAKRPSRARGHGHAELVFAQVRDQVGAMRGFAQGVYRSIGFKFGSYHDVAWVQRMLSPSS